jgi:hypothetical protein
MRQCEDGEFFVPLRQVWQEAGADKETVAPLAAVLPDWGQCRRFPPNFQRHTCFLSKEKTVETHSECGFSEVQKFDWCGEYKAWLL